MKELTSAKNEVAPSLERSTYREKSQIDLSQDRNLDTSILSHFPPLFNVHFFIDKYLKLEKIFHAMDIDHNGLVSKDELTSYIQSRGIKYNPEVIAKIFDEMDSDNNFGINL